MPAYPIHEAVASLAIAVAALVGFAAIDVWLGGWERRRKKGKIEVPNPRKLKHKYRAKPTVLFGRRYDSKREARYAAELETRKRAGEVIGWLEQVPFHLPGGIKYVCDFLVFEADGSCRFVEVKGVETQVWRAKMKIMQAAYPWAEIEVVK